MEKWLILSLGQEMYEMNLEYIDLPESKETIKDFWSVWKDSEANLKGTLTGQRGEILSINNNNCDRSDEYSE